MREFCILLVSFFESINSDSNCYVVISGGKIGSEFTDEAFKILLQNNSHHGNLEIRIEKSPYEFLPSKRAGHKLALWHNIPMLTGGELYAAQRELKSSECYLKDTGQEIIKKDLDLIDEEVSQWQLLPDMNEGPRQYHSMVVFRNSPYSGTAWVCGGELWKRAKASGKLRLEVVASCECFNRYYMKWIVCPTMIFERKFASSASSYFGIYMIGGEDKKGRILSSVEYVEPLGGGKWKRKSSLPIKVKSAAAVCIHDKLFLFGGFDGEKSISTVYHLNRTNWVDFGNLLTRRFGHTVTAMQSTVLIYGGEDDGEVKSAEVLNIISKTSEYIDLPEYKSIRFHAAVGLGSCDVEGYFNSCCIINALSFCGLLLIIILTSSIYIGFWRSDLWVPLLREHHAEIKRKEEVEQMLG